MALRHCRGPLGEPSGTGRPRGRGGTALKTLLLIEDAADLSKVVARELGAAGYRVVCAADGPAGLRRHEEEHPDAVILDWMLPGLDGLEVLRRLRRHATTPVLMLTARGDEADRVIGLELGADDYLTKPFSMRELLARVRALLRRSELLQQTRSSDREGDAAPLAYGDLEVQPAYYIATIAGKQLDLSRTEFGLLRLLLANPGRAFSRAYLLDTIWGETYFGGDRSVDNAVLRLRRKLGPVGDAIETVWGVGYRLRPLP
ncbi:MAG: response regulator transcription factor [Anaerolineae bacterium]